MHWAVLLFMLASVVAGKLLPYGAHPSQLDFFNPASGKFFCRNGDGPFPLSYINDDYCDCEADGSDEPGTSACRNGFLYCANEGYFARNLSSRYVDDGICDCCDGSDEPQRRRIVCENTCAELASRLQKRLRRRREVFEQGSRLRLDAIERKRRRFEQIPQLLADLERERDVASAQLDEEERRKAEADKKILIGKERKAREKKANASALLFARIDANKDGIVTMLELNETGVIDRDTQFESIVGEWIDLNTFTERLYDQIKHLFEVTETAQSVSAEEEEEESSSSVDECRARVDEIKQKISKLTKLTSIDFGESGEFFELYDSQLEFKDADYRYTLRPFDRIVQSSGAGEVLIGEWDGWQHSTHKQMLYSNGHVCPNGKARVATVNLKCGVRSRITSVNEVERCVYLLQLQTPGACKVFDDDDDEQSEHDELLLEHDEL